VLTNVGIGFSGYYGDEHDPTPWNSHVLAGNTVNGRPVYYFVNQHGFMVPTDGAQVILAECSDVVVDGLESSAATSAVSGAHCDGVEIAHCDLSRHTEAISLYHSTRVTVQDNGLTDNIYALRVNDCPGARVISNRFGRTSGPRSSAYDHLGINAANCSGLQVEGNVLTGASVEFWAVGDSRFCGNRIWCGWMGLYLDDSSHNELSGNTVANCHFGLLLGNGCHDNTVFGNDFAGNDTSAGEESGGNAWNAVTVGNYWSDFAQNAGYPTHYVIGPDPNSADWRPEPAPFQCPYPCGKLTAGCWAVDLDDFAQFAACWSGPPGGTCLCADLDGNGGIDLADFAEFAVRFGTDPETFAPACARAP
jgi:parallel beta-helix repeat protein